MKSQVCAVCCSILFASVAWGAPAGAGAPVATLVQQQLIAPLVARAANSSQFSRGPPGQTAYRAVIADGAPTLVDANGHRFVPFTVDSRTTYGGDPGNLPWNTGMLTGCVTVDDGVVYVKRGDGWRTASVYVGATSGGDVTEPVCVAATAPKT